MPEVPVPGSPDALRAHLSAVPPLEPGAEGAGLDALPTDIAPDAGPTTSPELTLLQGGEEGAHEDMSPGAEGANSDMAEAPLIEGDAAPMSEVASEAGEEVPLVSEELLEALPTGDPEQLKKPLGDRLIDGFKRAQARLHEGAKKVRNTVGVAGAVLDNKIVGTGVEAIMKKQGLTAEQARERRQGWVRALGTTAFVAGLTAEITEPTEASNQNSQAA